MPLKYRLWRQQNRQPIQKKLQKIPIKQQRRRRHRRITQDKLIKYKQMFCSLCTNKIYRGILKRKLAEDIQIKLKGKACRERIG